MNKITLVTFNSWNIRRKNVWPVWWSQDSIQINLIIFGELKFGLPVSSFLVFHQFTDQQDLWILWRVFDAPVRSKLKVYTQHGLNKSLKTNDVVVTMFVYKQQILQHLLGIHSLANTVSLRHFLAIPVLLLKSLFSEHWLLLISTK